jgi:hypothetical protein
MSIDEESNEIPPSPKDEDSTDILENSDKILQSQPQETSDDISENGDKISQSPTKRVSQKLKKGKYHASLGRQKSKIKNKKQKEEKNFNQGRGKPTFFRIAEQTIVTMLLMLAFFPTMSYGAYTNSEIRLPGQDKQISLLNAIQTGTGNHTFDTYTMSRLDVVTFETELHGAIMDGNNLMITSCNMLNQWQDLCS